MIERIESWIRRFRRRISRSELSLKLLRLREEEGSETEPGLLLIQIDGLSRSQFERAMAHEKLPFLRTLMRRDGYEVRTHYSGQPASTPAVQAEIFYGVRTAVPAFSYYDRERGEVVRMFDPEAGERMEEELKRQGEPLLKGGSSYSNIYAAGAAESHFCVPDLGWGASKTPPSKFRFLVILLMNVSVLFRMLGLMVVEFFLAWADFFRGIRQGESLWKELKFVPTRVAVSIMLREFIVAGASMDLARGLPVVHLNFLGYDEQAHRRGPSSAFAHWTLLGIDGAIRRLQSAAARSRRRDYAVWIYSDHGQEESVSFERETGWRLNEVLSEVFDDSGESVWEEREERGFREERAYWSGGKAGRRGRAAVPVPVSERIVVTAMGPVGHVYDLRDGGGDRYRRAERMVQLGIPLVLFVNRAGEVEAVSGEGRFVLPRDAERIFGPRHRFAEEVGRDLVEIVKHPRAGDFVISGWRRARRMISFAAENGAHGGPGREEVSGFLLLPPETLIETDRPGRFRPVDLRNAVRSYLDRRLLPESFSFSVPGAGHPAENLRILTYNVHGCVGMDSKLSPARIARVISRHRPNIVAMQEVDVGRTRSGLVNQARAIADLLRMRYHFYPVLEREGEQYGLAVLSYFPIREVKTGILPGLPERPELEPRGAQWLEIAAGDEPIQFVNTHLGLRTRERRPQVLALLGEDWLGGPRCGEPMIICGDLNAMPSSYVHRTLSGRFEDVQILTAEHRPRRTLYGRYPLGRIDHIFVSSHFEAHRVEVPRTTLARVASDHLPVFCELKLRRLREWNSPQREGCYE